MLKKTVLAAAAATAMLSSATVLAAGDEAAGEKKAQTCMGCHGVDGYFNVYPSYRVPKLWGQHADFIVASLKAYRDDQRVHETMKSQAADLSDQDMADIAAFFANPANKP
ncbi:MAG: cytochrome c [Gammaproteobacteria bacterium]|nr:cytochrome c [Gammaproteobacteria bacterium]